MRAFVRLERRPSARETTRSRRAARKRNVTIHFRGAVSTGGCNSQSLTMAYDRFGHRQSYRFHSQLVVGAGQCASIRGAEQGS